MIGYTIGYAIGLYLYKERSDYLLLKELKGDKSQMIGYTIGYTIGLYLHKERSDYLPLTPLSPLFPSEAKSSPRTLRVR